jgi:large repetitive protein
VNSRTGERTRSLVRFAIPTIPTGCQVASAELRLYNASPKAGRTIPALQLAGNWTESVVNWNNQPTSTSPYKRRYNDPLLVQLQQGLGERLTKR